ncbi:T9SS type A sorting domain-containing protein, partial [Flavobacterium sp. LS2P90]
SVTITQPTAIAVSAVLVSPKCNGGTDGSITITATGGTGTLMYSANDGLTYQASNVFSGLTAGTYLWAVKDANNCVLKGTVIITQPTILVATDGHSDVKCNRGTDGSVTVTFSGGTSPYMVNFNGTGFVAQTSPKVYAGLTAGSYTWIVKDANGCIVQGSETIAQPTILVATDAHADVKCNGGTDGSVTVTFNGGTAPYMVNFNGGGFLAATSPKAYTGLTAGTYTWVVKDANGCEQSGSETIAQPTILVATDAHVDVKCNGGTDGSVTVTFSGGTAPYMVNFNGGGFLAATSPKAYTGLTAGTYTWVVKDANGCEQSGSETIAQPTILVATDAHVDVKCNGGSDGSITVTFSGGTAPYMVNFNGAGYLAQTSPKVYAGLAAGSYTWIVKDANGCIVQGSETIAQPTILVATDAHADVKCNGGTDGSVTVTFSGGTSPYMVNFNGGGFLAATSPKAFTGLTAGTYTWVVKDANGCEQSGSETIAQPTILVATDAHVDVKCNGGTDGSVTVTFSGGTAPYMVNFNGGGFLAATSPKAYTGLTAGTYTWVVKDANGCEQSGSETIAQPTILVATDAHVDVKCNGGSDGSVTVTFSGGTAPYMVNFNGAGYLAQTSPKVYAGLAAGSYTWIVKDANGCIVQGSETIAQPTILVATDAHADVKCNGGTDGSVTVTFSGGTAPYMVNFNGGGFLAATSPKAYTGLTAGTYTWVVKDANGCEQSGSETIAQPTILLATDGHSDVKCNGGTDGSVTVTFSGGTSPYMVNFNGAGFVAQTSPKVYAGLVAGSYTWIVKDANGCEKSGSEVVGQPTILVASATPVNPRCCNEPDGSITLTFSGGTSPYMVNFNGAGFVSQTSPKVYTGLIAGSYTWIVKDANGCIFTGGTVTLTNPPLIVASAVLINPKCNGGTDGSITITATGGTGTLTYSIDQGVTYQASNVFTGLAAGEYKWRVKDANDCLLKGTFILTTPPAVQVSATLVNPKCNGGADGSITVNATGGTAPFMYSLNDGVSYQTSNVFNALAAGQYKWAVKEANGCISKGTVNLINPSVIVASATPVNPKCSGGTDGSFTITATGGTGILMYSKDDGATYQTSNLFSGLAAGDYKWAVKDANNCILKGTVTLVSPTLLAVSVAAVNPSCCATLKDGSITLNASGGTGAFMYSINGGTTYQTSNFFGSLTAGVYNWIVKDANNCVISGTVTLRNPTDPLAKPAAPTVTASFTAYPVPFKDVLTIRYDFDYQSDVTIEVLNSQGMPVLSKTDTNSYLGKEIMLHLHTYQGQEQVYLVKVTTDRGSSVKKVMSSK